MSLGQQQILQMPSKTHGILKEDSINLCFGDCVKKSVMHESQTIQKISLALTMNLFLPLKSPAKILEIE